MAHACESLDCLLFVPDWDPHPLCYSHRVCGRHSPCPALCIGLSQQHFDILEDSVATGLRHRPVEGTKGKRGKYGSTSRRKPGSAGGGSTRKGAAAVLVPVSRADETVSGTEESSGLQAPGGVHSTVQGSASERLEANASGPVAEPTQGDSMERSHDLVLAVAQGEPPLGSPRTRSRLRQACRPSRIPVSYRAWRLRTHAQPGNEQERPSGLVQQVSRGSVAMHACTGPVAVIS